MVLFHVLDTCLVITKRLTRLINEFGWLANLIFDLELVKIMASRWESLDATSKQPYLTAFRNEMVTFSSRLDKYNKSLNQDQREVIDQLKLERQLQKEKKEKRKRLKELGKPKKPATPYFLFVTNKVPKGSGITEYQAAAKDLAAGIANRIT